ncbi:transposable element [Tanacetum coccineum]
MISRPPITTLSLSVFMQVQPSCHDDYAGKYNNDLDFQRAIEDIKSNRPTEFMWQGYNEIHRKTWDESIPFLQFAINHTVHSSTNKAPSEVCLGFLPQSPFDMEFTIDSTQVTHKEERYEVKVQRFVDSIRKIHEEVDKQLRRSQQKYKERHDQHQVQGNFQEGDLVWLHLGKDRLKGEGKKLKPIRYDPFQILKKIGENACKLELPAYMELYFVVNVDKLKLFDPSMLDDEPGESLPCVDDLVTEKETVLTEDTVVERKTSSMLDRISKP